MILLLFCDNLLSDSHVIEGFLCNVRGLHNVQEVITAPETQNGQLCLFITNCDSDIRTQDIPLSVFYHRISLYHHSYEYLKCQKAIIKNLSKQNT